MIDSRSENGDSQAAEEDRAPAAGALPLAAQRQAPGVGPAQPRVFPAVSGAKSLRSLSKTPFPRQGLRPNLQAGAV